jgi:hypothetical protein
MLLSITLFRLSVTNGFKIEYIQYLVFNSEAEVQRHMCLVANTNLTRLRRNEAKEIKDSDLLAGLAQIDLAIISHTI